LDIGGSWEGGIERERGGEWLCLRGQRAGALVKKKKEKEKKEKERRDTKHT